jgi:outer membrane biosynthesis protein TonB
LIVTVDSKNLDGDIDVFTAITFRPLMKTTVYATSQSPAVTKGIYLRAHQLLILRIEARTPNDDPGTYHIHFGGTFEPFSGGIPVAENTEPTDTSTTKSSNNRLSSVGATLPRPPPEITETAEAKPSPSPEKPAEKASDTTESTKPEAEKPKPTTARTTTTRPPRRSTRPTNSRRPPARKTEPAKKSDSEIAATESKSQTAQTEPDAAKSTAEKSSSTEKSAESTAPAENAKPQEITSPLSGTRLIIEEKDGARIERPMSTVRRVVIEGATIVVLLKNGRTERIAMANVARMSIEPQQ